MKKEPIIKEERVDTRALVPLLILTIVEYEVFTFSKVTVAVAKQDAWLSILIGAVIGSLFVYMFIKLAARFPNKGYFEYLKIVWGKPLGFMISIIYIFFWIAFLSSIFYETTLANKMLFLQRTPTIVPLAIFILTLIWLVSSGFFSILRFFQLLLPFLAIPLITLAVLFITAIKLDNFFPVFDNGFFPVLKGTYSFLGAYQGPEVLLFTAPFFLRIKEGVKSSLLGYNITVFFGWSNTVAAIGILGVANIQEAVLPGISVVNLLEFPGFPVERFGLLLTLPWLIAMYSTLAIYLYLLSTNTIKLFNLQKKKRMIVLLTLLPACIAYFLPNETWHEYLRQFLTLISVPVVYLIPILTLFLAVIRKKGRTT